MEKISTLKMSHKQWLETRRIGIGGSDVAAIMGLSPWKSPLAVYMDKLGMIKQDESSNERMYWGTVLEEPIVRRYAELNNVKVRRNNHILINEERPYMIANVDREVRLPGLIYGVEAKTTDVMNRDLWADEGVPVQYVYQVQHYMAVTGYPYFDVVCLLGGNTYIQRRVDRDEDLIGLIIEREEEFWWRIEKKDPPDWDGSKSSAEILKLLYPKSTSGKVVALSEDIEEAVREYQNLDSMLNEKKQDAKDLETRRDAYKQKICAALGDAEVGIIGDIEVSFKTINVKAHEVKDSSYRKFKIKERMVA